jgi:hypothetical protein
MAVLTEGKTKIITKPQVSKLRPIAPPPAPQPKYEEDREYSYEDEKELDEFHGLDGW